MYGKQIDINFDELEQFGFNRLTGEACALSMRQLVDLNESAVSIFANFTGGCYPANANYNSGSVKSCFISWDMLADLITFCYMDQNPDMIMVRVYKKEYMYEEHLRLMTNEEWDEFRESDFAARNPHRIYYIYSEQERRGLSNVHGFTGRSQ